MRESGGEGRRRRAVTGGVGPVGVNPVLRALVQDRADPARGHGWTGVGRGWGTVTDASPPSAPLQLAERKRKRRRLQCAFISPRATEEEKPPPPPGARARLLLLSPVELGVGRLGVLGLKAEGHNLVRQDPLLLCPRRARKRVIESEKRDGGRRGGERHVSHQRGGGSGAKPPLLRAGARRSRG